MSWDIFIQQFPDGARRVTDIPDTFTAGPIGRRDEVISKIREAVPQTDFSDPAWGVLRGDGYTIEFGLGDEDVLYGITLHVRGSDEVLPHITRVLNTLGLRAIDSWTGEFFDPVVAAHSLARWRSYIEEER
ncbi:MAG TPA: hypothetical protein VGS96_01065 [Thermoanaerobaculia bacterium]|jgi:hypothetical protein|nr:hypothetical protein [Thermoanaerobaculia bacterium]